VCVCVHSATGVVYSWGSGIFGQLGHGNLRDRFSPLMVGVTLRGLAVTQVACHDYYSAAVTGQQGEGLGRVGLTPHRVGMAGE